jgi:hypothetical protein
MAEPTYPPARHPITDARTGLISRPWLAFFQRLGSSVTTTVTTVIQEVGLAVLPSQAASTLLGRRSASAGTPEAITLGTGLTMSGTTLSVVSTPDEHVTAFGRWEPLSSGIVASPELIYADGDVISVWVKD